MTSESEVMMETECIGSCGWNAFGKHVECDSGNGSCWTARILQAEDSPFHDKYLADATVKIKENLEGIPPRSGYTLSFVHTDLGTLLAWVHHGTTIPDDAVRYGDDDAKIAEALGLILDKSQTPQNY